MARKPRRPKNPPLKRVTADFPKNERGGIDKKEIKRLYFEYDGISWAAFCHSKGWDFYYLRTKCPTASWTEEKKKALGEAHIEELEGLTFDQLHIWRRETLNAMRDYPKACNRLRALVEREISMEIKELQDPTSKKKRANQDRLMKLANTLSTIQQTHYRALCISDVSLQIAMDDKNSDAGDKNSQGSDGFTFEIKGKGGEIYRPDVDALSAMYDEFMDKPRLPAPDPSEEPVEAEVVTDEQD